MSASYTPPNGPLVVLYQDDHLILIDKPAGLLSVPGKGEHLSDSLLTRLEQAHPETLLVHRLDRDTSGVIVFARTRLAQRHLGLQFERRHMQKTYVACVAGSPEAESGSIDLPLAADWPNRPRQMVDMERGKPSRTGWRVIERMRDSARVELSPETGRSHQLRVHMAWIGHPILGDPLYATPDTPAAERLMLHARSLSLRHPDGGARVTFSAPCPI